MASQSTQMLSLAVACFAAFSLCDVFDGYRDPGNDTCLHLEQVDTEEALKRLRFLREILRRVLRHHGTVTQVTLCVDSRNHQAQVAYEKIGFELWQRSASFGDGYTMWGKLKGGKLKSLRATATSLLVEHAPSGTSFTELTEATMLQSWQPGAAARPSPPQSLCRLAVRLCAKGLQKRHLSERHTVRSFGSCEEEAKGLLTSSSTAAGAVRYFYVAVTVPQIELGPFLALLHLKETSIPASGEAAVRDANAAWEAACKVTEAKKAAAARMAARSDAPLWRRVYDFCFVGPPPLGGQREPEAGEERGYAGSESLRLGQPRPLLTEWPKLRAGMHIRGYGAAWTARYSGRVAPEDFR